MIEEVVELMKKKILRPPVLEPVLLKDYQTAVHKAQEGMTGTKQIFVMDEKALARINEELKANNSTA